MSHVRALKRPGNYVSAQAKIVKRTCSELTYTSFHPSGNIYGCFTIITNLNLPCTTHFLMVKLFEVQTDYNTGERKLNATDQPIE